MARIRERIKNKLTERTLANKIRYSYIALAVPFVMLVIFCIRNLWESNNRYEEMIGSTLLATEFGLDFKEKFDYETYLLIAGDTPLDESKLKAILLEARKKVNEIFAITESAENKQLMIYVLKYLTNLEIYTERIESNLAEGNKYEQCIEIWENDVQVVTTLISDTMSQYVYLEVREIQNSKTEYQRIFHSMIISSFLGFGFAIVLILVLSYTIPRSLTRPITEITQITDEVANGNLSVHADEYRGSEAKVLADSINVMIDRINNLLVQIKEEQLSLRKAEFELFQAQINPHFLYNTLDAIVWLAETGDNKKVVDMVENLSSFFRTSLNHGREMVTVRDEIMHIRSYLSIQQVRYQDILHFNIDVDENIMEYSLPKLSLQPFIENALYHGIKEKRGGGTISVFGKKEEEEFFVEISDDGAGMTGERLGQVISELDETDGKDRSIYGMYNVNQRMKLTYGKDYRIEISSELGKGTTVRMIVTNKK